MKRVSMKVALCAVLVFGAMPVAWSAQAYKPCSTITPGGKIPSVASLQDEISANYGKEYASKAVQFLRVLDEKKDVDKVSPSERLRLEFDVLYSFAHEQHRPAYSLRSFLDRAGVQTGTDSAPELKTEVDWYKIAFRACRPWHVYLFQMDATGKIDPLFPNEGIVPGETNPVRANADYQAPPGRNWATLDKNVGFEKIYLFVSKDSKPALEALYPYFIDAGQQIVSNTWKKGGVAAIPLPKRPKLKRQKQVAIVTRGFGGVAQGHQMPQFGLPPSVYIAQETEVVQTLWFRHK